jgi:cell division septum initiation protein DivIVA
VTDNQHIFYEAWINDLQRDLDSLREDKRELLRKVAQLEQLVAEYGNKINNLIQQRGDSQ